MPPMFYFCYWIGTLILDAKIEHLKFELSFNWLMTELLGVWQPFLLGCFIVGAISALLAYIAVRLMWRYYIWIHIKKRRDRGNSKPPADPDL